MGLWVYGTPEDKRLRGITRLGSRGSIPSRLGSRGSMSVGFAVFVGGAFLDFFEDAEVGGVAGGGDAVVGYGFFYGAAGFACVSAVAVFAVVGGLEDFGEEMSGVFYGEVDCAETSYAGDVDYLSAVGEVEHLGEGGGVGSGVVEFRDFTCA